ncbi:MAG: DUF4332 domain-containing protein [Planctomycetota bacterium]
MKIERAAIEGVVHGAVSDRANRYPGAETPDSPSDGLACQVTALPTGLAVVVAESTRIGSQLCGLIGETLYGAPSVWGGPDSVAGEVDVATRLGRFRLRRSAGVSRGQVGGRFTIAGLDGQPASGDTIEQLLPANSAQAVARVFYATPATHGDIDALLSDSVARQLHAAPTTTAVSPRDEHTGDLLARRDAVTREIELRLADRRRESETLETLIAQLDGDAADLRRRREAVEKSLRGVESELASVESSLRYQAIAEETERAAAHRESADWRPRIDELEDQIQQWRGTLADLEAREAEVRTELSTIHPDDAEPSLPLADQRAGLAVSRRLVEDLESEVARLARSAASDACVCRDAHPRMNPLVDTLGKQLDRLATLAEQQERALHVQSLKAEAEHVARSQEELRKQLDHLLGRRQALWRTTRARPEENVRDEAIDADANDRLGLDARRAELRQEIASLDARIAEIAARRDAAVAKRSTLLADAPLEALQAELNDIEGRLRAPRAAAPTAESVAPRWRASEWFAKLTDGRFTGLGLVSGGRRLVVIEPGGAERSAESLLPGERQLAAISLRLALVGGFAAQGVDLPLVLDDPFTGLDNRQAAILANVLDDFSRLGFQSLVCTTHGVAIDRFKSLGVPLLRMAPARVEASKPGSVAPRRFEPGPIEPQPPVKSRVVRQTVAREYLLSPTDPIERFPVPIANREAVFARSRVRTIDDLISADPSALAEELDRDDVTAELAALWQTHTAMVCFVPGMTFERASLLTEVGVLSAEDLAQADREGLLRSIEDWQTSERGRRYERRASSREEVGEWIAAARRGVERWRDGDAWSRWSRHRGERRQRVERNATRRHGQRGERLRIRSAEAEPSTTTHTLRRSPNGKPRRPRRSDAKKPKAWRFYLETTSPVVDAPSIGAKTADRLGRLHVLTVADLLAADAELVAAGLQNSRITAETVVAWQHQAQLVCRVPELRGHDAQVLVECGFTQPEEIAAMKPAELLEFVDPFCATAEGQKVLRGNKTPDLVEVTDWINWAQHCRRLGAA